MIGGGNQLLDSAMIITKTLTKSDIERGMILPKQEIESVKTRMGEAMASKLEEGQQVRVHDIVEGDTYTVTLKCVNNENKQKYCFGEGWSTMRWSLDLEEGQVLKLYWDAEDKEFYILNFSYQTIPLMIPV